MGIFTVDCGLKSGMSMVTALSLGMRIVVPKAVSDPNVEPHSNENVVSTGVGPVFWTVNRR